MNLGIDIDESSLAFLPPLIDFLSTQGIVVPPYEETYSFDLERVWGCSREEAFHRVHLFYASREFLHLDGPISGAAVAFRRLSQNHVLYQITSRSSDISFITRIQVERAFPGCVTDVLHTNQYSLEALRSPANTTKGSLCRSQGIDLFVEDALHHAAEIASHGVPVLLLPRPWNYGKSVPTGVTRVANWDMIVEYVESYKNALGND